MSETRETRESHGHSYVTDSENKGKSNSVQELLLNEYACTNMYIRACTRIYIYRCTHTYHTCIGAHIHKYAHLQGQRFLSIFIVDFKWHLSIITIVFL